MPPVCETEKRKGKGIYGDNRLVISGLLLGLVRFSEGRSSSSSCGSHTHSSMQESIFVKNSKKNTPRCKLRRDEYL